MLSSTLMVVRARSFSALCVVICAALTACALNPQPEPPAINGPAYNEADASNSGGSGGSGFAGGGGFGASNTAGQGGNIPLTDSGVGADGSTCQNCCADCCGAGKCDAGCEKYADAEAGCPCEAGVDGSDSAVDDVAKAKNASEWTGDLGR